MIILDGEPISAATFVLKLVVVLLRSADSYVSAMEISLAYFRDARLASF